MAAAAPAGGAAAAAAPAEEQTEFTVILARDGEEALEKMMSYRPDLVLSDVMMPKMDGFALLKEIRATPEIQGTPVILLSARAGEEAKIEGLEAGADDYLVKPFGGRELVGGGQSFPQNYRY